MHELVLVLSDLYLSQETPDRELPAGVRLPGIQHVARFGSRSELAGGWRPWLSRWLTNADAGATAAVAAVSAPAAATSRSPEAARLAPKATLESETTPAFGATPVSGTTCASSQWTPAVAWVATPMHLIAGMTSVHVDRRSILRLDAADQSMLASEFQRVFRDSGFHLQPLEAGDFLMLGPDMPVAEAQEPARALGGSMGQHADTSVALRRLGAEIEMWLHDHPINDARRGRGELPVTSLWLWGGGRLSRSAMTTPATGNDIAYGRDSYLQGLWAMQALKVEALPEQLAEVFSYPDAQRAVLVIEIGLMLQLNSRSTFFDAVAAIDRQFIAPAVEALDRGQYQRLVVIANDYEITLRASDRFKFWRRTPLGLSGLQ